MRGWLPLLPRRLSSEHILQHLVHYPRRPRGAFTRTWAGATAIQLIDNRLNQLSKQQVHLLAKDIRSLNHGADGGGILGLVLVILLIVYLFERI